MSTYYNEWDPYAAAWLRNLVAAGHLPAGDVDERSIADVRPDDLRGYVQCHFFAGMGGWAYAARLAGWHDDRELFTGSCPCQPFSVAGRGRGADDVRHLWPEFFRLIAARRPAVVMGEQVAAAVGKDWLDGVFADLEGVGYACGAVVVPACAVDAPHRRDRLWFVADAEFGGQQASHKPDALAGAKGRKGSSRDTFAAWPGPDGSARDVAEPDSNGWVTGVDGQVARHGHPTAAAGRPGAWSSAEWLRSHDGKARRIEPGIRLLAHGIPARVPKLRALGNAIVPQVAAEVIAAFMECRP